MRAPWEPMYQPRVAFDTGGGGGGTQWANSQSTSTSGPNPTIAPKLESILGNFWDWYGKNSNAPAYYPGQTVAPLSDAQKSSMISMSTWDHGTPPVLDTAIGSLRSTMGGDYLDVGRNPYWTKALEASFRPQAEQFRDIIAPSIDSKFAGSGRTAGGAHFDTTMRGVQDLERAQSDAAAKAASDQWSQERGRMLQAAGIAPSVGGAVMAQQLADAQARTQGGAMLQGQQQRVIDADVARYNYGKTAQPEWLARMAQIVQGMYPGGQTTGSSTSMGGGGGGGGFGSILGAGMGIAGLGLQALPLFGFSDERLKDVEGRVGTTDDGLPLYLYRYKGDDQPRIGPMAQEVAQVKPEAVARHPSGYLAVDYAQLMPEGGLF
jgi:hypothetical protein